MGAQDISRDSRLPEKLRIERGDLNCLPDIMNVMNRSFSEAFGERWNIHQCRSMLTLPKAALQIAYHLDTPCGFTISRAVADEMELLMIAVTPSYQNHGIGRLLLRSLLENAELGQINKIFLEVRSNNPAQNLYKKMGFEKSGIRKSYYTGLDKVKYDAITYTKIIIT